MADQEPKSFANSFSGGDQFLRFSGFEVSAAMAAPKIEPGFEMPFLESEGKMFLRHRPLVTKGAAGDIGPEIRDLLEVRGPVGDLSSEDRPDLMVLAHIRIEVPQQIRQALPPAQAYKKGSR